MEADILLFIQEHLRVFWLDPIMKGVSLLGNTGIIWILTGIALLFFKKTRRAGFDVLLCLLTAFILNNLIIKNLVARVRPYEAIAGLEAIVPQLHDWSFPSGHACSSFAAATSLALSFGKKGAWSFILATLIAISRVYVGVHYPSDVIVGIAVGSLTAYLTFKLSQKYIPFFERKIT